MYNSKAKQMSKTRERSEYVYWEAYSAALNKQKYNPPVRDKESYDSGYSVGKYDRKQ